VKYTQAFAGQEIANTPPSHATIGSGVFPSRHGVEGIEWKDPTTGALTRPTDRTPVQHDALEAVLTAHHAPSIAAQVKATNPHDTVLSVSGHKCYASDAMGTASADVILCAEIYHDRWVAQAVGRHQPPPGAINNSHWDVPIPPPTSGFGPGVEQWKVGAENHWLGGHPGPGWEDQHIPFVIAGAGIKHGIRSSYPARLVDIAPTVERLLGLRPSPSDGIVLADSLIGAGTNAARKQQALGIRLSPMVRALQERSLDR
jgi:predicted AlkP superfamily pyrophosphatase or phosphodiesterase